MAETVSVLMLDIQGSTPLVKQMGGEKYLREFMPSFHAMISDNIQQVGKYFQKQEEMGDDCVKAVFASPQDAVSRAVAIQNRFRDHGVIKGDDGNAIQVQLHLAIHTCPILSNGSPDVAEIPDLARLLKEAHDGQILLSPACHAAYVDCMTKQKMQPRTCEKFGGYFFQGIDDEQSIYSLLYDDVYRGAPGTQFIGFENLEAANEYITRTGVEKQVRDKFEEAVGSRGGKIRFVTICGEGGMGKTRLSINCARQLVGRFPGYVVFVPLAGLLKEDDEAVAEAIYSALNLPKSPGTDFKKEVRLHLKNRPATLLVLDNAEIITPHDDAVVYVQELLADVPQLCILASSRAYFGFDAEGQIDINEGLTPWEAFQLFGERVRPGFVLPSDVTEDEIAALHDAMEAQRRKTGDYAAPPSNASAAERTHALQSLLRLFWLANRNTLALELIASWTNKYKAIDQLLTDYQTKAFSRFTRHAGIPSGNEITRLRHKSLEASYLWSWNNLGAEENGGDAQAAFLAAALFAAPFTDEAIEAVLGWNDADRTADATFAVQKAALLRSFAVTPTETRYLMHWQLQKFGRDEKYWQGFAEDESGLPPLSQLRQNLVGYYWEKTEVYGGEKGIASAEGRAWLDSEWRNVVAAADDADTEAQLKEAVWLRLRLSAYFSLTSKWRVWEDVGKKAKASALRAEDKYNQGATFNNLGTVYRQQGKWKQAEDAYNQSLEIDKELGDRRGQGATLNNLGGVYQEQGKWKEAEDTYNEALVIMREFGDRRGQGQTLNNLGTVYRQQGKWKQAEDAYNQSLAIKKEFGDRYGQGSTLNNLGNIYREQGKWKQAEDAYNEALVIMKEFGDRYQQALTVENLGIVYRRQGKWQDAENAYKEALKVKEEFGDRHGQGQILGNLSILWINQGEFSTAAKYAREGIALMEQTEDTRRLQWLQQILAYCFAQGGAA